jgi:hypothetical protein
MFHLGWFLYVKKFATDLSQVTDKLYHIKLQDYLIKFVSDLRQVGGFLQVLRFPPPI